MRSILRSLVLMLCMGLFTMSCLTAATIAEKSKAKLSIHDFDVGVDLESVVIKNLFTIEILTVDYILEIPNIGYIVNINDFKVISNDIYVNNTMKRAVSTDDINHYEYYKQINYDNIYKLARDLVT